MQECLWAHLREETYITRFYRRLEWRKGPKKAATAAARKLLAAVW
jgi:hypothetical protein